MKSKKAKEAIERYRIHGAGHIPPEEIAEYCRLFGEVAEIAEQEAEERMRRELTRWHDPDEQPDDGCICLLKFQSNGFFVHYEGGIFTKKDGEWHDSQNMFTYNRNVIIAWRPMYDN